MQFFTHDHDDTYGGLQFNHERISISNRYRNNTNGSDFNEEKNYCFSETDSRIFLFH